MSANPFMVNSSQSGQRKASSTILSSVIPYNSAKSSNSSSYTENITKYNSNTSGANNQNANKTNTNIFPAPHYQETQQQISKKQKPEGKQNSGNNQKTTSEPIRTKEVRQPSGDLGKKITIDEKSFVTIAFKWQSGEIIQTKLLQEQIFTSNNCLRTDIFQVLPSSLKKNYHYQQKKRININNQLKAQFECQCIKILNHISSNQNLSSKTIYRLKKNLKFYQFSNDRHKIMEQILKQNKNEQIKQKIESLNLKLRMDYGLCYYGLLMCQFEQNKVQNFIIEDQVHLIQIYKLLGQGTRLSTKKYIKLEEQNTIIQQIVHYYEPTNKNENLGLVIIQLFQQFLIINQDKPEGILIKTLYLPQLAILNQKITKFNSGDNVLKNQLKNLQIQLLLEQSDNISVNDITDFKAFFQFIVKNNKYNQKNLSDIFKQVDSIKEFKGKMKQILDQKVISFIQNNSLEKYSQNPPSSNLIIRLQCIFYLRQLSKLNLPNILQTKQKILKILYHNDPTHFLLQLLKIQQITYLSQLATTILLKQVLQYNNRSNMSILTTSLSQQNLNKYLPQKQKIHKKPIIIYIQYLIRLSNYYMIITNNNNIIQYRMKPEYQLLDQQLLCLQGKLKLKISNGLTSSRINFSDHQQYQILYILLNLSQIFSNQQNITNQQNKTKQQITKTIRNIIKIVFNQFIINNNNTVNNKYILLQQQQLQQQQILNKLIINIKFINEKMLTRSRNNNNNNQLLVQFLFGNQQYYTQYIVYLIHQFQLLICMMIKQNNNNNNSNSNDCDYIRMIYQTIQIVYEFIYDPWRKYLRTEQNNKNLQCLDLQVIKLCLTVYSVININQNNVNRSMINKSNKKTSVNYLQNKLTTMLYNNINFIILLQQTTNQLSAIINKNIFSKKYPSSLSSLTITKQQYTIQQQQQLCLDILTLLLLSASKANNNNNNNNNKVLLINNQLRMFIIHNISELLQIGIISINNINNVSISNNIKLWPIDLVRLLGQLYIYEDNNKQNKTNLKKYQGCKNKLSGQSVIIWNLLLNNYHPATAEQQQYWQHNIHTFINNIINLQTNISNHIYNIQAVFKFIQFCKHDHILYRMLTNQQNKKKIVNMIRLYTSGLNKINNNKSNMNMNSNSNNQQLYKLQNISRISNILIDLFQQKLIKINQQIGLIWRKLIMNYLSITLQHLHHIQQTKTTITTNIITNTLNRIIYSIYYLLPSFLQQYNNNSKKQIIQLFDQFIDIFIRCNPIALNNNSNNNTFNHNTSNNNSNNSNEQFDQHYNNQQITLKVAIQAIFVFYFYRVIRIDYVNNSNNKNNKKNNNNSNNNNNKHRDSDISIIDKISSLQNPQQEQHHSCPIINKCITLLYIATWSYEQNFQSSLTAKTIHNSNHTAHQHKSKQISTTVILKILQIINHYLMTFMKIQINNNNDNQLVLLCQALQQFSSKINKINNININTGNSKQEIRILQKIQYILIIIINSIKATINKQNVALIIPDKTISFYCSFPNKQAIIQIYRNNNNYNILIRQMISALIAFQLSNYDGYQNKEIMDVYKVYYYLYCFISEHKGYDCQQEEENIVIVVIGEFLGIRVDSWRELTNIFGISINNISNKSNSSNNNSNNSTNSNSSINGSRLQITHDHIIWHNLIVYKLLQHHPKIFHKHQQFLTKYLTNFHNYLQSNWVYIHKQKQLHITLNYYHTIDNHIGNTNNNKFISSNISSYVHLLNSTLSILKAIKILRVSTYKFDNILQLVHIQLRKYLSQFIKIYEVEINNDKDRYQMMKQQKNKVNTDKLFIVQDYHKQTLVLHLINNILEYTLINPHFLSQQRSGQQFISNDDIQLYGVTMDHKAMLEFCMKVLENFQKMFLVNLDGRNLALINNYMQELVRNKKYRIQAGFINLLMRQNQQMCIQPESIRKLFDTVTQNLLLLNGQKDEAGLKKMDEYFRKSTKKNNRRISSILSTIKF